MDTDEKEKIDQEIEDNKKRFLRSNLVKIVDVNHPNFTKNPYIHNPEIRALVREFLLKMTDANPENRPSMDKIEKFFNEIISQYLLVPARIHNTALLNMSEYETANDDKREQLIKGLKQCEETWLIDNDEKRDPRDYVKLKRELESKGVAVGETVFQGENAAKQIPDHIQAKPKAHIHNYFLVTSDEKMASSKSLKASGVCPMIVSSKHSETYYQQKIKDQAHTQQVDPAHLKMTLNLLNDEKNRLLKKYKKDDPIVIKRLESISNAEEYLKKNAKTITYSQLNIHLNRLEKAMQATSTIAAISEKYFGHRKSTGEKNIAKWREKLSTDIEIEMSGRFKPRK